MVAVTVRTLVVKSSTSMMAALPDAISTIMVSPIARPKPKTTPAAMPGSAAGRTTRRAT